MSIHVSPMNQLSSGSHAETLDRLPDEAGSGLAAVALDGVLVDAVRQMWAGEEAAPRAARLGDDAFEVVPDLRRALRA